ncbi:MAG: methyltransferase domain-containing protein [Lachnospiraceae bacterium]|nr:methyltransferase domain-containing protein [Lachnospiraceae bacterium]
MHDIKEIPAWDRLLKRILWEQIGELKGKKILDFGSGQGITADYFAKNNEVIAIEPSEEMIENAWRDNDYVQVTGNITAVKEYGNEEFDVIFCHNVLEYIDDKQLVLKELSRVLKKNGTLSIVKHNRIGRIMQMAVLLNDIDKANAMLDGKNFAASKYGEIKYYDDDCIIKWCPELRIKECLGIRTFWDLQQNQDMHGDENWQMNMKELEQRCSSIEEFKSVAFFHHLLLGK